jgi:hypothetical protein
MSWNLAYLPKCMSSPWVSNVDEFGFRNSRFIHSCRIFSVRIFESDQVLLPSNAVHGRLVVQSCNRHLSVRSSFLSTSLDRFAPPLSYGRPRLDRNVSAESLSRRKDKRFLLDIKSSHASFTLGPKSPANGLGA